MKKNIVLILILCLVFTGCGKGTSKPEAKQTMLLAAAASLKNCTDKELIPMFEEKYPNIKVEATYDSSGKLQTQIEEGADVDVFMSAAMKQMNLLNEKELIITDSITELLENKVVLIVLNDSKGITSFEEIIKADVIAIGDPDSVPAGQYAKEVLENLRVWDSVLPKLSLGTNVTEVLNWVAEGSADAGVVYATDAASNENVIVLAEAPEGSVSKVIYPVGIVKASKNQESAKLFTEFLQSKEAMTVFEKYGFSAVEQ